MKMEGITGEIRDIGYSAQIRPLPESITYGQIARGMFGQPNNIYLRALYQRVGT
jgi:hypothetical protein